MVQINSPKPGQFCWLDLAAADALGAKLFYREMFDWAAHDQTANGGVFTRLALHGADVGSVYQLSQAYLERGAASHWTPYVRVADAEASVRRAVALGGEVFVEPFTVDGFARIALIADAVGAPVGLWEPLKARADTKP
jgi:predicted enzyme related to lactoylglutathione lyase